MAQKQSINTRLTCDTQELFEEQSTIKIEDYDSCSNNNRDFVKVINQNHNDTEDSSQSRQKSVSQHRKSVMGRGTTSSTILMLDKQLQHFQKENKELKERLDTAYKMQHQLENDLEEVQVETKRKEEDSKNIKRRF